MDIDKGTVIQVVGEAFNVAEGDLFNVPRGGGRGTPARCAARNIARETAAKFLGEIAEAFGLAHYGSVSGMNSRFTKQIQQDKSLGETVRKIEKTIN